MKKIICRFSILLMAMFIFSFSGCMEEKSNSSSYLLFMTAFSSPWNIEPITDNVIVWDYSYNFDSSGNLHVCYIDQGSRNIRYATNCSGSWVFETIDSYGVNGEGGIDIALDSYGNAHVCYFKVMSNVSSNQIIYATNSSGSWDTEITDDVGRGGYKLKISLDASNFVHIIHFDDTGNDIEYLTNSSGSWVSSTLLSGLSYNSYPQMLFKSIDNIHISYIDSSHDLIYATNASGSWVPSTIENVGTSGGAVSMALDSSDNAHISYYESTNHYIKYATNASGSWVSSNLKYINTGSVSTTIGVDNSNFIHVCYTSFDSYPYSYEYITNKIGEWKSLIVKKESNSYFSGKIKLNSLGKPNIVYYNGGNHSLKYIHMK